jgi:hypothetical protein
MKQDLGVGRHPFRMELAERCELAHVARPEQPGQVAGTGDHPAHDLDVRPRHGR